MQELGRWTSCEDQLVICGIAIEGTGDPQPHINLRYWGLFLCKLSSLLGIGLSRHKTSLSSTHALYYPHNYSYWPFCLNMNADANIGELRPYFMGELTSPQGYQTFTIQTLQLFVTLEASLVVPIWLLRSHHGCGSQTQYHSEHQRNGRFFCIVVAIGPWLWRHLWNKARLMGYNHD